MAADDRELSFRSSPKPKQRARKYDILRIPGSGAGGLILLGHAFTWHELHYWRRRTTPHFQENCEACEHNTPIRERGYIAVTPRKKIDVQILEVTDQCEDDINAAAENLQTLRGQMVSLERMEKATNGKLRIEFIGKSIDQSLLPESPDVEEVLRRVWGMRSRGPMNPPASLVLDMDKLACAVRMPSLNGQGK